MFIVRSVAVILLVSVLGCGLKMGSPEAGVAPEGTYVFTGTVDGEVVSGTLEFGDPVIVSSSHGTCERLVYGLVRWGGSFGVTCPEVALRVVVRPDGELREYGFAELKKVARREERTTCRTYNENRTTCLAWNTALVEYDEWVRGRVQLKAVEG